MKFFDSLDNKKKTNLFIIVMIVIIAISYFLFSPSGIINRVIQQKKYTKLQALTEQEKHINDSLTKRINQLRNDSLEIERIAREKYGMKKPGETIYLVPSKK
ncbi:MAG TPA: septum formation initiator family protein [Candidatus Kapabacteria bacterium]|nr:septum formation initiator family protein [Candidatus Kapabacteria bacterium]